MRRYSKKTFFIVVFFTALLLFISLFGLTIGSTELKGATQIRFGIDIRGGVEATYEPRDLDRMPTETELNAARAIIETRMDAANISDRDVTVDKSGGKIIVRFPWRSDETDFDPQKAVSELGETAMLTFRDPKGNIVLEGTDVAESYATINPSTAAPVVVLKLTEEGKVKFAEATKELAVNREPLSIYMDETEISSPIVDEPITDGNAIITGAGSLSDCKALSDKINSGSLPFSMIVKNCNIISATLGANALSVMVRAGILAFALVCLFMIIYYRLSGIVACIALVLQVVGQLLALSVPQFTLTLPGIAGVILSIGMGVDANVITSERIREELRAGRTITAAIDSGFHRAFSSVFDGNITVIIVGVILLLLGSGSILSFGYTLVCGVIMNFVAGVTASRLMMRSLTAFESLRKPRLFMSTKAFDRSSKRINFFRKRYLFFAISLLVLLSGVLASFINGVQMDIQFKGGTILKYTYSGTIDAEEAEDAVDAAIGKSVLCQLQTNFARSEQILTVSLAGNEAITSYEQEAVTEALEKAFPDNAVTISETLTVEPFIGKKFLMNGLLAIGLAFALILVYVGIRFRNIGGFSAGLMAIVALVFDSLVVAVTFVIFKIPLNDYFIAAILTIIGFSINDTIVIYDRIRENRSIMSKAPIDELVDVSITQSMSRSINTNIAVFMSITVAFIFAQIYEIESIREFALPMMLGTVSGCYSTICIAGPLWTMWKKRREKV
jgi:SecD/SecF fusion protein